MQSHQPQITAISDKLDLFAPTLIHLLPQPGRAQSHSEQDGSGYSEQKADKAVYPDKLPSLKQKWAVEKMQVNLGLEFW